CGDETDSNSYVYAYCDSDAGFTNFRDCPVAYVRKNPAVSTVSVPAIGTGENQLLNPDRSGPLTVVASGGASLADANTNFITGGANRLDLGLANDKTVGTRTLRLNELGGNDNATSGFVIATGLIDNAGTDVIKNYVGLLSGTSLGAPLSDATHGGTWGGKMYIRMGKINAAKPVHDVTKTLDFKLVVNYDMKTLSAVSIQDGNITFDTGVEITRFSFSPTLTMISPTFSITNGKFTDNGVIYGTTNLLVFSRNTAGTLTGLIGRDGAVGIFASDGEHGLDWDYVGGFVATPTAPVITQDFAKWEDSFDTGGVNADETLRRSGFSSNARIIADYIKLDRTNKVFVLGTLLDTTVVRLNETMDEDGYESGFAYASHSASGTNGLYLSQAYVGLLATTDVGQILYSQSPINTVWTGRIAGTFGDTDFSNDNFQLNISYGPSSGGKITTPIFGDAYYYSLNSFKFFGSPTVLPIPAGEGRSIAVNGTFNSAGVISGRVAFNSRSTENGTLTGLIGQSGAVAVFNGLHHGFQPYAGGFVIAPKSCIVAGNCVGFGSWENSFAAGRANADNTLRAAGYQASAGASAEYIKLGRGDRINEIPIIIPGGNKVGDTATAKTLRLNNIHEGGYESGVVFA
ncbi:MAG: hypothetical protein K8953_12980, partial [Proteobacteria bacterium]|nr:hypothetical protein [Pseudomonadota bacterium]